MSVAEAVLLGMAVSLVVTVVAGFPFVNLFRKLTFGKTAYTKVHAFEDCVQGPANFGGFLMLFAVFASLLVVYITDSIKSGTLLSSGSLVDGEMYSLTINGLIFSLELFLVGAVNEYINRYNALAIDFKYNYLVIFVISLVYNFSIYIGLNGNLYIYIPNLGALPGELIYWCVSILIILTTAGCSVVQSESEDEISLLNWFLCFIFLGAVSYLRNSYGITVICATASVSSVADYLWIKKPKKLEFGLSGNLAFCGIALAVAYAVKMPYAVLMCGFGMIVNTAYKVYAYSKAKSGAKDIEKVYSLYCRINQTKTTHRISIVICAAANITLGFLTVGLTYLGM